MCREEWLWTESFEYRLRPFPIGSRIEDQL